MQRNEHPLAPQTVNFTVDNGLTIRGEAWGMSDAPPVLLLHGGGQTRYAWGNTARTLAAQGWYAIALDLRGHGESDWASDGDYSIDAFIADLRGVAARLSQAPALVGASLGGITSLLAEGEATEPMSTAVVLVDVTPRIEEKGAERILSFMKAYPQGFARLEEAADAVAEFLPHRSRPRDLSGLAKNVRQGPDGRYRWHWDPQMLNSFQLDRVRNPERMLAAAKGLRSPTLLVRGRMSDIVSEAAVAEFRSLAPHAQYVDVADASHMVAGDRNDAFSEAVVNFLAQCREHTSA
jgi:pimeloyl-ACP methyl ester carboxylesterase